MLCGSFPVVYGGHRYFPLLSLNGIAHAPYGLDELRLPGGFLHTEHILQLFQSLNEVAPYWYLSFF